MPETLRLQAPGKINMHLRVFPVGADGFHPLRSWFRTVDLFDVVTMRFASEPTSEASDEFAELTAAAERSGVHVRLSTKGIRVPDGDENLAIKAVYFAIRRGTLPIDLYLEKQIPLGAGLGGGSSDAAASLKALGRLVQCDMRLHQVSSRTDRLGSDVPFFLHHQLDGITDAVCTGRGEIVQPFTPGRRHAVLLMLPGLHVATPAVYRLFDAMPPPEDDGTPDFQARSALPAIELLPLLRNDLEPPAFALHPELGQLRADLEQRLGRIVRMTGSGSTLFTLFDDRTDAEAAASGLKNPDLTTLIA